MRTGDEWHYAWNSAGHLVEVVRPDGGVVRFTYDALGRRVSKSYKGKVTRWVWDGNQPLHEWTELVVGASPSAPDDLVTWLFEDGSFLPLAKLQGQERHSILTDYLGTPVQMHDTHGQQVWAAELDSYGQRRRQVGEAIACPFRYQGQYEDAETGLYYNRFRYYDPEVGQYISQDPIGLTGGMNLYAYVNDPLQSVDQFGLVVTYGPLDALGRPTGIFADLTLADLRPTGSSPPTVDPTGWIDRGGDHPHHHQRSHLLADSLGGSGREARNLVILTDGSNNPGMSSVEGEIRRHIRNNPNERVLLSVIPHYNGTGFNGNNFMPNEVTMYALDHNGDVLVNRTIPNGLRQNTACRGSGC